METRCCQQKFDFQRYPPKYFCAARYEHKSSKKRFKLFKKPEKKHSWADLGLIPVTMGTRCFHKKLEFQRYPPKDFCTARYERKSSKKKFQTFQKPRKKSFMGRSWAKIGLRKTQPNVCSKRRDSESWTDIDRQNQRLRHEI